MTPNTRQRKSRAAQELSDHLIGMDLTPEEEVELLRLTVTQRGLEDMFRSEFVRKPTKAGRKLTSFETRSKVLDFWHNKEYITESTITTRLARMRITERPKIQSGLPLNKVPVDVRSIRNVPYYEAQRLIFDRPLKELYLCYLKKHPDNYVSYGTWFALRPFYVRVVTTKDVEMCVCKTHLHARRAVNSLVALCKKLFFFFFSFENTTVRSGCARFSLRSARTYKLSTFFNRR